MGTSPFQRILFATDFSDAAAIAREEAVRLTIRWGAELGLLHVMQRPTGRWYTLDHLYSEFAEQFHAEVHARLKTEISAIKALGIEVESTHIQEGEEPVFEQVEARAAEWGADLIVIGSHGQDQAEVFAWGTVASSLVRTAPVSVLTVRTDQEPGFQVILAPVDFSPACREALKCAAELARQSERCSLHILHVCAPAGVFASLLEGEHDEVDAKELEAARAEMGKFLGSVDLSGVANVTTEIRSGKTHAAILDYAKSNAIDLICMSTLGRRGLSGALMGSTTERVLRGVTCSMLTRRHPSKDF